MSAAAAGPLRLVTFGELDGSVWAAALSGATPALALGAGSVRLTAAGPEKLTFAVDGEDWRLSAEGLELTVSPRPAPGETEAGAEHLCSVAGRLSVDGVEHQLDCPGTRSVSDEFDFGAIGSLRAVSSWFAADRAVALRAVRPRGRSDHEEDRVAATLFDPEAWIAVDDPRLSTTFGAGESPSRTSLEMWIGPEEEQYPRRTAGEALGPGSTVTGEGLRLGVTPLRCHAGGLDGAGVYVLAQFT